jgi:hypothetical protein
MQGYYDVFNKLTPAILGMASFKTPLILMNAIPNYFRCVIRTSRG